MAIDETGRLPGRGAYLCRDAACFDVAGRRRALEHALAVAMPADIASLVAAGPGELLATTEPIARAVGSRPESLHHPTTEGGAHGQE